jgi:hypothetical protein
MARRVIPILILLAVVGAFLWNRARRQRTVETTTAYVSDPTAAVWNTNAQVRQQIATLKYGDKVSVLQRSGDHSQVRSDSGTEGWVDTSALMDADIWQQGADILARARKMPVQARGHTRTISNVRLIAGRDGPRIYQLGRNDPVVVLERTTRPVAQDNAEEVDASSAAKGKMEDWLLVMRDPSAPAPGGGAQGAGTPAVSSGPEKQKGPYTPIAGWVLARFIELDAPPPIPDYFNASNLRVAAWMLLNTVPADSEPKPQYLVAGNRGGEGQPCDFTALRVYTWDGPKDRYETAFVENDICGKFPITVTPAPMGADFHFADPAEGGADRAYIFRQTVVRRVSKTPAAPRSSSSAPPAPKAAKKPARRKK